MGPVGDLSRQSDSGESLRSEQGTVGLASRRTQRVGDLSGRHRLLRSHTSEYCEYAPEHAQDLRAQSRELASQVEALATAVTRENARPQPDVPPQILQRRTEQGATRDLCRRRER